MWTSAFADCDTWFSVLFVTAAYHCCSSCRRGWIYQLLRDTDCVKLCRQAGSICSWIVWNQLLPVEPYEISFFVSFFVVVYVDWIMNTCFAIHCLLLVSFQLKLCCTLVALTSTKLFNALFRARLFLVLLSLRFRSRICIWIYGFNLDLIDRSILIRKSSLSAGRLRNGMPTSTERQVITWSGYIKSPDIHQIGSDCNRHVNDF